jgi:hypothetical protein
MIQAESPYFYYTEATTSPGPFENSIHVSKGDSDSVSNKTCESTDLTCDYPSSVTVENFSTASTSLYSRSDDYVQLQGGGCWGPYNSLNVKMEKVFEWVVDKTSFENIGIPSFEKIR